MGAYRVDDWQQLMFLSSPFSLAMSLTIQFQCCTHGNLQMIFQHVSRRAISGHWMNKLVRKTGGKENRTKPDEQVILYKI
ncbi:hypothetical protein CEXT_801231 [Caerostris extrusa]|uniref:Uncharacterized protein n=1 Tax=Caerostris extrusa TaxID=172846 RepID=A0AAV4NCI9_CAEEX|nr:hypothetical protein CEXT_801231 [Caerostris extrusa]